MRRIILVGTLLTGCLFGCEGGDLPPKTTGGSGEFPVEPNPPPVSGAFSWYAAITSANNVGNGFAVAPDGHVALVFTPTASGTVAGVPFSHYGEGTASPNYDVLVAVLDKGGQLAWSKSFSTEEIEAVKAAAFDEAGDLYVVGLFKDNKNGLDFGNGVTVGVGPGELSNFVVKLRGSDGTALWATSIQSGDGYVGIECAVLEHSFAVHAGHGAVACFFTTSDLSERVRIVSKAGTQDIAPVIAGSNQIIVGFDPANGSLSDTYVFGGPKGSLGRIDIRDDGKMVAGGQSFSGTLVDSVGSAPLDIVNRSCLVVTFDDKLKPLVRRTMHGDAGTICQIEHVAFQGADQILVAGHMEGNVDLGDGLTSMGVAGFVGTLGADLSNARPFERYPDAQIFGLAVDPWGQTFVGMAYGADVLSTVPHSFSYTKRDVTSAVIWTSKTYTHDPPSAGPWLQMYGIGVDYRGTPTVFGTLSGPFLLDDGAHGAQALDYFAARFEP